MRRVTMVVLALLVGLSPERADAQRIVNAVAAVRAPARRDASAAGPFIADGDPCDDWRVRGAIMGAIAGAMPGLFGLWVSNGLEVERDALRRLFVRVLIAGTTLGAIRGALIPPPRCR